MNFSNVYQYPPYIACWLQGDDYDHPVESENKHHHYLSASQITKPVRMIILEERHRDELEHDVSDMIAVRYGTAIHAACELAWKKKIEKEDSSMDASYEIANTLAEQRMEVPDAYTVDGETFTVRGKFDLLYENQLYDLKSTSVWSWILDSHKEDYQKQASVYAWLLYKTSEVKVKPTFKIIFIFTDWSQKEAKIKENYPPRRIMIREYPILEYEDDWETGNREPPKFIQDKCRELARAYKRTDDELPECTEEELWRTQTVYKYYLSGRTDGRATKVFQSLPEAEDFKRQKSERGVILTIPGEPRRCAYCTARPFCNQYKKMFPDDYRTDGIQSPSGD